MMTSGQAGVFLYGEVCAAGQGGRLCGGDKGAIETEEVCDCPLDPFAAHTHIS